MKKWITAGAMLVVLAAVLVLSGGRQQLRQGDTKMTFFFSGEVVETGEGYLRITVHDSGNSGFAKDAVVEVSAASADVAAGEYARVLMDRRGEEIGRLEAYSVYRIDETGQAIKG